MGRVKFLESVENYVQEAFNDGRIDDCEYFQIINDAKDWLETAKSVDCYTYDDVDFELEIQYGIAIWSNECQRTLGEPLYVSPMSSDTDLELIKSEVEKYNVEPGGCIEIYELDQPDDSILLFEKGEWIKAS